MARRRAGAPVGEGEPAPGPSAPASAGGGRELWREARYRIAVHAVPLRGGGSVERAFIDHPGAVVIWAEDADGRVALLDHARPALGSRLLELPAGTLRPGEAPRAAAKRELQEETGLRAGRWRPLGAFYLAPGSSNERMWAFAAAGLTAGPTALDADEQLSVRWVTRAEVWAMAADGRLQDAKSLAVIARLRAAR